MDANAACSEIPSEYSMFMCKAETLHYLHVCLLRAAAVLQALKCAFLPRERTVLHIPGICHIS